MVSLASVWPTAFEGLNDTVGSENDGLRKALLEVSEFPSKIPDKEASPDNKREEKLECPICFEPMDAFKYAPHVLCCGHTLCKNCILGLQHAVLKFQNLRPIILPFFISCPWCKTPSFRLAYKGNLRFPCKNYFLLWMIDSFQGPKPKSDHQMISLQESEGLNIFSRHEPSVSSQDERVSVLSQQGSSQNEGVSDYTRLNTKCLLDFLRKAFTCFTHTTPIFPLTFVLLFVILSAIPVNASALVLYVLIALCVWSAALFLPEVCFPDLGLFF